MGLLISASAAPNCGVVHERASSGAPHCTTCRNRGHQERLEPLLDSGLGERHLDSNRNFPNENQPSDAQSEIVWSQKHRQAFFVLFFGDNSFIGFIQNMQQTCFKDSLPAVALVLKTENGTLGTTLLQVVTHQHGRFNHRKCRC